MPSRTMLMTANSHIERGGKPVKNNMKSDKTPLMITARLIEGTNYFRVVKDRVTETGSHPYLQDGPEWDIGFHLFSVIVKAAERFGGFSHFNIIKTTDLARSHEKFEPGYGFEADVELMTKIGMTVPIHIIVGKGDRQNGRYVDFAYKTPEFEFSIRQLYTPGQAIDPVWVVSENEIKELAEHQPEHDYYSVELQPDKFGHQTRDDQNNALAIAELCFMLREQRLRQEEVREKLVKAGITHSPGKLREITEIVLAEEYY